MDFDILALLILALAAIFVLAWAFVGWLKFREHHHLLRDDQHYHKSHVTWIGRVRRQKRRPPAKLEKR
jgi:hypothetical protein